MVNSNTIQFTEPNYLGYLAIRQPTGLIKMYFNGRDVSNELAPIGVDLNKAPIIELDGQIAVHIDSPGGDIGDDKIDKNKTP